ncbi:riboflavin synthase [Cerasicoccus arenae]|uniref:Riboflavin synthase n=1 Tax=Cerasicoccus arenae TaxID=424488 RepID=A0A8J3GDB9_9BACT|nr:riboflavin synthase [Cerasicoccus arenae]MBK1859011.1 riboflavin synthase [Cerasicoccus arenae]GHB94696.1 riboflavin synthase subunit alpha [Cerasicoccus arenae]
MFTGIVEETGEIISFAEGAESWRLVIRAERVLSDLGIGDSLACNGCCLTVVEIQGNQLSFDLLDETVRLTSLAGLQPGDLINLERSLAANGRFGGHVVSGHVDATGEILVFEERGKNHYLKIRTPAEFRQYLIYKGSIAIDGMSLTVAEVHDDSLAVWLIPHTLEITNLRNRRAGEIVNLEFDLLAKYVERMLAAKEQ